MADERLAVLKTWKLFIKGAYPRSESGRTLPLLAHDFLKSQQQGQ